MTESKFSVGQHVRSLIDGQGLKRGEEYEVTAVDVRRTPFGGFTTYTVRGVTVKGAVLAITNGHLVLTEA